MNEAKSTINLATAERESRFASSSLATVSMTTEELIVKYERKIADHGSFIRSEGVDPPEIAQWRWSSIERKDGE